MFIWMTFYLAFHPREGVGLKRQTLSRCHAEPSTRHPWILKGFRKLKKAWNLNSASGFRLIWTCWTRFWQKNWVARISCVAVWPWIQGALYWAYWKKSEILFLVILIIKFYSPQILVLFMKGARHSICLVMGIPKMYKKLAKKQF